MTRSERTRAWLRLGRAFALTLLGVTCGSGAHVFAGGAAPGVGLGTAIVLLLTVVSLPLAIRPPRFVCAAPLLLAHQLATHVALTASAGPAHGTPTAAGHHGHVTTVLAPATQHASHEIAPSFAMACAHAGAALLLGWLIADTARSWSVVGMARQAYALGTDLVDRAFAVARQARIISIPSAIRLRRTRWISFLLPHLAPLEDLWRALSPVRRGPPLLGR